MKHFTSFHDVDDLSALLEDAFSFKKNPFAYDELGKRKTLGLVFLSSSLRTRLSTQKAALNLGMSVMVLNIETEGWKLETQDGEIMDGTNTEHVKDAAAVMGQYCDIIGIQSVPPGVGMLERDVDYADALLKQFVRYAGVPIINLQSAILHPLQSFADLITIEELKEIQKPKVVLSWAPHVMPMTQAIPNSFLQWMNNADVELVVAQPEGYELSSEFVGKAEVIHNQNEGLLGADFVYAKSWCSYNRYGEMPSVKEDWRITREKMNHTNNAFFMHSLPIRRNVIATDEVLDSPRSIVHRQAGNRLYATQAVLKSILKSNNGSNKTSAYAFQASLF
ncbi:acetylornithine carbamoyltransferase [Xanthovirga aplysinae]|uniref:acetylornithine carbamoyltransferase n=1 Tax=Xanthovirga aplysinae TaxID=2529853 RepID=UPI0012BD3019|nr:acetylornithine carbamoyltransferase [Xanthovirga aplysinae]MTI33399.1 acetylornithine carbamoyltransferase [Xanthovirga aplysinae]